MDGLPKRASLVQLVVDDGLIQVISLEAEPFDLPCWSPLIHRLLMGPDGLESLLQERLAGLCHAQDRSLHRDLLLRWALRCSSSWCHTATNFSKSRR